MGDLTFLHDSTGLVIGPDEPRPDLTIVVVNDDGGGLFSLLEQGAPEHAAVFERVFGTPHGVDLAALCAATGTSYDRLDTASARTTWPSLGPPAGHAGRRGAHRPHAAPATCTPGSRRGRPGAPLTTV